MQLSWNAGFAYDTWGLADAKWSLLMPLGAAWRLVTVASFALEQSCVLTLCGDLLWIADTPVAQRKSASAKVIHNS